MNRVRRASDVRRASSKLKLRQTDRLRKEQATNETNREEGVGVVSPGQHWDVLSSSAWPGISVTQSSSGHAAVRSRGAARDHHERQHNGGRADE